MVANSMHFSSRIRIPFNENARIHIFPLSCLGHWPGVSLDHLKGYKMKRLTENFKDLNCYSVPQLFVMFTWFNPFWITTIGLS